ncbi:ABC transporter ATP-binding protein [Citricoccus sp. SGAir0253]|uniref:ABC transporter ATP-binding protein n=1 Tax=Citricoccus sp. SGAir0253 TaxID=2567881 RepID=UPI0010CD0DE5|nr:ABC transporter ATP-binding protein [Citricoccus sp. SGAir0253]QCU78654.1 ABC transporter ATP-binding protein [Citricoccus sp. SGAir0253]
MLTLNDVTLAYPDGEDGTLYALDGVDLTVPDGQLLALVGPSGSGKSSLLAVAAALVSPTAGSVRIDGTEVTAAGEAERARIRRERVGLVFQQPRLLPSLTALEQLELVGVLAGNRPRAVRTAAREALAAVGLSGAAHRRPHQLSGGQRQRVNIARALLGEPAVLLVDEPTSALDHERSAEVMDLLATLTHERSTATVVVTHDLEFVPVADRSVTLRDGRIRPGATH